MKRLVISLTDKEWKEAVSSVRHELGEPLGEKQVEKILIKEVANFIRETYVQSLAIVDKFGLPWLSRRRIP
jgi:thermostable 8-oxoguanine DNA glycosylase